MRRWILRAGAADLDGLLLEDAPVPEPGPGEVRVRVRAVSLNYRDQIILRGDYGQAVTEDLVPVSDGAGEVDAVGDGVEEWSVGDRVTGLYYEGWYDGPPKPGLGFGLGSPGVDGMLAEYVVLKADRVTRMPESLSFKEAATLPCAALTAWTALNGDRPYDGHRVGPGGKVLVLGTGGVSLFALILARAMGAEVFATTSREEKAGPLRALGAEDVVNYRDTPDWGQTVFERTGGVDRVVNAAGGAAVDQSVAALAYGGEMALMGLFSHGDAPPVFPLLMAKGASIRGTAVGSAAAHEDLVRFVDETGIKPPIDRAFGFEEAKGAYRAQAGPELFGKIVIDVA